MTKKIAVLSSQKSKVFDTILNYFKDKDVEVFETDSVLEAVESDLCVLDGYKGHLKSELFECTDFIRIHPSLLPAFDCDNAVEEAFKFGVKVSGVTINYVKENGENGRIIAQYPVFADVSTTLEEFEEEILKTSQKLAPFVIESILNDVIFSFDMLLKPKSSCDGGCSGCKH